MTSNFCDVCDVRELPIDPITIWENIPCPPPEFKDTLFSAEVVEKLGPEKGVAIVLKIAKRCGIEVPKMFPTMGHLSSTWIFDTCGQDCVSTTIGICLSILLVMVIVTLAGFARRECGWFQSSRDKYVIDHINTMMSEDGTASEYKFSTRNTDTASRIEDKTSKIDDELSSIYVARWFKIFVGDNYSDSGDNSMHRHSTTSRCICKRLAEHVYEDIDSVKNVNENTEMLSESHRKYSDSDENIVLMKPKDNECDSIEETYNNKFSTFNSNDYQTLKIAENKTGNGDANQNQTVSHLCLNELQNDTLVKESEDKEGDFFLSNGTYTVNTCERLNSDSSSNSVTPLLSNDAEYFDTLTATV